MYIILGTCIFYMTNIHISYFHILFSDKNHNVEKTTSTLLKYVHFVNKCPFFHKVYTIYIHFIKWTKLLSI